jgi:hypothetical protein
MKKACECHHDHHAHHDHCACGHDQHEHSACGCGSCGCGYEHISRDKNELPGLCLGAGLFLLGILNREDLRWIQGLVRKNDPPKGGSRLQ